MEAVLAVRVFGFATRISTIKKGLQKQFFLILWGEGHERLYLCCQTLAVVERFFLLIGPGSNSPAWLVQSHAGLFFGFRRMLKEIYRVAITSFS